MLINKLQTQVNSSNLTEIEKLHFGNFLGLQEEQLQNNLADKFIQYPWLVTYLYVNTRAKFFAIENDDVESFDAVVKESEKVLDLLGKLEEEKLQS